MSATAELAAELRADLAPAPVKEVLRQVRAVLNPPPALTVSEFSDAELIVTTGPLQGTHWQTSFAPYQRGILDAFHEPGVETVVIMGSSQWGKTACAVNVVAYHIAHDPCPILVVEPTVDPMAKDFSRNRLEPVIEATPILRATVGKRREKNASNTTLAKTYNGGAIAIGGANSAASLAARPTRLLVLDEIDRYPLELPGEGSTISIALKRTTSFGRRRRILMLSSPTIVNAPIHAWFNRGDRRRFFVPCPACGVFHTFEWKNVRWTNRDPLTALIHCPECDHGMDDAERIAILSFGEWRPTRKKRRADPSVVSFHVWEAYSPLSTLAKIVRGFIHAREAQKTGDQAEMHTWQNTTLGEPVELDAGEGVEPIGLLLRREEYAAPVPADAVCLTMGVDTQDASLEALVIGWGIGEESWIVDRVTLPGDTSQPEPWAMLDELLTHEYKHESGQRLPIAASCIDSAGHRTDIVYDFAARHAGKRLFATIGRDGQRPIVSSPSPRRWGKERRKVPLYTIGVDAAKALLMDRLSVIDRGPGFVHIPRADWADEELAAQLTSERLITRKVRGVPRQSWKKIRVRNEALDCYVLAIAALRLLRPDLELVAERLANPDARPAKNGAQRKKPFLGRRRDWLRKR